MLIVIVLDIKMPYLQDFEMDAMKKFIEEASIPIVTIYDKDPNNHPYVKKFFNSANSKAI